MQRRRALPRSTYDFVLPCDPTLCASVKASARVSGAEIEADFMLMDIFSSLLTVSQSGDFECDWVSHL